MTLRDQIVAHPAWWRPSVLVGQTVDAWRAQLAREERARLAWQVRLWIACAQADLVDHLETPVRAHVLAFAARSGRDVPSSDIWLTISEAARAVGCQRVTIHVAVRDGTLQTRRDPGSIKKKVRLADVEQWQQARPRIIGRPKRVRPHHQETDHDHRPLSASV